MTTEGKPDLNTTVASFTRFHVYYCTYMCAH